MVDSLSSIRESNLQSNTDLTVPTKESMGKDDFLKLLVAQMQAQDPLNPMDSADFSAQLAQFSALEQMQNVNGNLEELLLYQASINNNMAINLIDKIITSPGNNLTISDGVPDAVSYELGASAATVTVDIYDSGDNLLASIARGKENAGMQEFNWGGKDSSGNSLPDGNYTFKISARDSAGLPVAAMTFQNSKVTGVVFENGISYAITGDNDTKIDVSDITSVSL